LILEPFWPGVRDKIDKVKENIEHHKALMTVNVTLEDITRSVRARKQTMEEFKRAQKFRDHQKFSTIRNEIRPDIHYKVLADIIQKTCEGSGKWLDKQDSFMRWLDPIDRTVRCLWVCGIPGAGRFHALGF
jgi:GTP1/Obg family GTP-binding protein